MNWIFDPRTETWVTGTEQDGAGVFQDLGLWWANVVHPNVMDIQAFGPFNSQEQATERVEGELIRLRSLT